MSLNVLEHAAICLKLWEVVQAINDYVRAALRFHCMEPPQETPSQEVSSYF